MSVAELIARTGHTIKVERPDATKDALGGRTPNWVVVATLLPCWVQDLSPENRTEYAARGLQVTHAVYVVANLDWKEDWRVTFRGRTMHVKGVTNAAGLDVFWKVLCKE